MATVTAINSRSKGGGGLCGALKYVSKDKKAKLESGRKLVSGVNCCPDTAYTEFMTTKRSWNKADGRQFYHFVQSFHPNEAVTPEQVHEIGFAFAARQFPGFEVVVATHVDAEHLHSHLIVNSVSFENGKKLHQSKKDLLAHRAISDEICLAHGLTVLPSEPVQNPAKGLQHREYRAAMRGDSWKFRLMNAIDHAMSRSRTRQEFFQHMRSMGYGVAWTAGRKHITYSCPGGMKCRDKRLHEPKYLKQNMEVEFEYRRAERPEPGRNLRSAQALPAGGLRRAGGTVAGHDHFTGGEPAPAAPDGADSEPDCQRTHTGAVLEGAAGDVGLPGETGWEASRRELEAHERGAGLPAEGAGTAMQAPSSLAADGLSLPGSIARLAGHLDEMTADPERQPRPKAVHEHKRAVGQKQDDHSGWQQEQTL